MHLLNLLSLLPLYAKNINTILYPLGILSRLGDDNLKLPITASMNFRQDDLATEILYTHQQISPT
jgi:hypothetical protein